MANKPPFAGEKVRVSEVFDLQMGKTPSRKNLAYWNNGDYEWVSIKDLGSYDRYVGQTKETISELGRKESGIKAVPANTLLMSFKLSLGKTAITTKPIYTNEAIMAFLDKGLYQFDLGYMWHQFRSKDWTAGTNTAVMGKTLNKQTLGAAIIKVPTLPEQISIAVRLDKVRDQLRLAEQEKRKLDQLVKSRFVEMFGDPYTNPLGWKTQSFDSAIMHINNGLTRRGKDEQGDIVIRLVELQAGFINYDNANRMLLKDREKQKFELHDGDLLFARVNGNPENVGRCAEFHSIGEAVYHNDHVIRAEFDKAVYDGCFLTTLMNLPYGKEQARSQLKTSAGQYTISQDGIRAISAYRPPLDLQQEFADFVAQVDKSRFIKKVVARRVG